MAETKKTSETKTVKSSEKATVTKTAAPKKTTTTKAAAPKATAEKKTTTKAAAPKATAEKKTTTKAAAPKAAAKTTTKAAEAKSVDAVKVEEVKAAAPKTEKKTNGPMIKVTLVKSGSGRLQKQIRTLKALGLNKTNSSNVLPDNKAVRGMIFVVKHLVSVEIVK